MIEPSSKSSKGGRFNKLAVSTQVMGQGPVAIVTAAGSDKYKSPVSKKSSSIFSDRMPAGFFKIDELFFESSSDKDFDKSAVSTQVGKVQKSDVIKSRVSSKPASSPHEDKLAVSKQDAK